MLSNFNKLGCNLNIEVYFLHSHLDRFPDNLGDLSEEQGERFHQDMKIMEERYQGRWNVYMMADYYCSVQRDCPGRSHSRKSYKRRFEMLNDWSFAKQYRVCNTSFVFDIWVCIYIFFIINVFSAELPIKYFIII